MVERVGHPAHGDDRRGPGYEVRDANPRALVRALLILTIVVVVAMFALRGMMDLMFPGRIERAQPRTQARIPTQGRGQLPDLAEQLKQLRQSEESELEKTDWVDRKAGIVQIPIERAMELIAEKGVPPGKGPMTDVEINSRKSEQK
jgi:hypothetical protein